MTQALGHHYESFRDRRILRLHCIITSHVPCTTQRVALALMAIRSYGKRPLGEMPETVVSGGVNPTCASACPPCWRRSNETIHDRRYALSLERYKNDSDWRATVTGLWEKIGTGPNVAQSTIDLFNFYFPCRHLARPTETLSNGHPPLAASSPPVALLFRRRMLGQIGLRD